MPLHEYLEQKRRQNIVKLNASGACHICGSTCRNSKGFKHYFLNGDENVCENGGTPPPHAAVEASSSSSSSAATAAGGVRVGGGGNTTTTTMMNYSENSMVRPPNLAAMRTCACFGIAPSDPGYWPYSLRVCDRCIEDDRGIGRIRNCGICGTVACDENCGPELLECTDSAEWNNAGCIECRRMVDFSEMDIFKGRDGTSSPGGKGGRRGGDLGGVWYDEPRITRVCAQCIEQSTPWVRYDFVCRRFRCETRLVPSDVVERKRFCTFGSSPLNLLPEDGLVAVVDFLSGSDLRQLFLTCSAMCTVAERVAKEKVEKIRDIIPTGPIVIEKRTEGTGLTKDWTHLGGTNDFGLRAPDDEKAWVGVYHYVEKILREMFYFEHHTTESEADKEVVGRFIHQGRKDKFAFGRSYDKSGDDLVECPAATGYSVRGGTVLVTCPNDSSLPFPHPIPLVVASSQRLETGIHHVICRLFCPGSGAVRGNRDVQSFKLGSIGILRTNQRGDGPTNDWAHRVDVMDSWVKDEVVFGLKYNADGRRLTIHSNSNVSRASRLQSSHCTLDDTLGELYIAVELTAKAALVQHTLLSVRNCDADEWARFTEHMSDGGATFPARDFNGGGPDLFDHMDALEAMIDDAHDVIDEVHDGGAQQNPQVIREARQQVIHEAIRNRRNERAIIDDEGGNQQRRHVRMAMEGGRRIGRLLRPRPAIPQMGRIVNQIIDLAADEDRAVAAAQDLAGSERFLDVGVRERPPPPPMNNNLDRAPRPPFNNYIDREAWRARRRLILRALRPLARAGAMEEELQDNENDGNGVPMQEDQHEDIINGDSNNE